MIELLTVTLNPSLDLSATTPHVEAGPKLRLDEPLAQPGGGGLNVAQAAAALGGQVRAVAALGGPAGDRIRQLMAPTGVALVPFDVQGESRICLAVTDRQDHRQFRFVLPGQGWATGTGARLVELVGDEAHKIGPGALVVLSGSQPPGVADSFPCDLARALAERTQGARLVIDTSGAALEKLVRHPDPRGRPYVLRMDQSESEGLAGAQFGSVTASADFAQALARRGVAHAVIVARGGEGSILATANARFHCAPPLVEVVSKVGAGDSFTGAFALALARGETLEAALIQGSAAATSAVMQPGTALCRAEDMATLVNGCRLVGVP